MLEYPSNLPNSLIVVTLTSNQKGTVTDNWLLQVVWSFPEGSYPLSSQLAQVEDEFDLQEVTGTVSITSLQLVCLLDHLLSDWIKT